MCVAVTQEAECPSRPMALVHLEVNNVR